MRSNTNTSSSYDSLDDILRALVPEASVKRSLFENFVVDGKSGLRKFQLMAAIHLSDIEKVLLQVPGVQYLWADHVLFREKINLRRNIRDLESGYQEVMPQFTIVSDIVESDILPQLYEKHKKNVKSHKLHQYEDHYKHLQTSLQKLNLNYFRQHVELQKKSFDQKYKQYQNGALSFVDFHETGYAPYEQARLTISTMVHEFHKDILEMCCCDRD